MFEVLIVATDSAVHKKWTESSIGKDIRFKCSFYLSTKNLLPESQGFDLIVFYSTGIGEKAWKPCYDYRVSGGALPIILVSKVVTAVSKTVSLFIGIDENVNSVDRNLVNYIRAFSTRPFIRREDIVRFKEQNVLVNLLKHSVHKNGKEINLTTTEQGIIEYLAMHPDTIYSAGDLISLIWSKPESVYEETIRCHIKNLRKKLDSNNQLSIIKTINGQGYKFGDNQLDLQKFAIRNQPAELGTCQI